jgi:hypothetical protein
MLNTKTRKISGFFITLTQPNPRKTILTTKSKIIMKKIVSLLALFFIFNSCDTSNDSPNYLFELLPVESVDIPTEFTLGGTYDITMHYKKPTTCHFFNSLYYEKSINSDNTKNIRTIAIEDAVLQSDNCQDTPDNMVEHTFKFTVTSDKPYIFKFWQGQDTAGNNIFLEIEVPVN